jgi:acetyltransferase
MHAMCRYRTLRDAPQGDEVRFEVDRDRAARAIASARDRDETQLPPAAVAEILEAYGFPLAPSRTVTTTAEAIAASIELGYPVVLKIESDVISHKTDVGGVRVDLRNADEVGTAFGEMTGRLREQDPDLRVQVQKMVRGGREVILGMSRDPQFGPLLMFGLGGVFVEVMRDVSVRIHPLTDVGAKTMIERIKGFPLLAGARGEKPVAIDFLEEALLRLSQLVGDFRDDLAELDVNPFIVTDRKDASYVVDARIALTD